MSSCVRCSSGVNRWLATCMALLMFGGFPAVASGGEVDDEETSDDNVVAEVGDSVWSFTGRLRPRLETRFNHRFGLEVSELDRAFQPDDTGVYTQQSRLGIEIERDPIVGRLTLQHTSRWGQFGGAQLTVPPVDIYEANLRYEPGDWGFVDVGRMELAYGDERVLGSVGWSQVGRTWDGLRVGVRHFDEVDVDLFGSRYEERDPGFFNGDAYLAGVYATADESLGPVVDAVDLYALYDLRLGEPADESSSDEPDTDTAVAGHQLFVVGSRADGEFADVDMAVEGAYQFGSYCAEPESTLTCSGVIRDVRAYFVDGELGYEVAAVRPFVGFSLASGDDPETETREAYRQMYPTAHAYLGYMDIIGPRTNLMEFRGGLQGDFDGIDAEIAVHDFTRLQPERRRLGMEFNTKIFVQLADPLRLGGGHGVFVPGEGMSTTDAMPQGVANWSFVQAVGQF